MGAPILQQPTLAQRLVDAGRDYVVLSSGSTGQTFLLNPHAGALGQVMVSAHGAPASSQAGRRMLAGLPTPPAAAPSGRNGSPRCSAPGSCRIRRP